MRLLLVEDDEMLGESARDTLRSEGYTVDWVRGGESADTALRTQDYDLVLLDLGLPQRDGIDVLRALRARGQGLAVLVITARDALDDRVSGLDAGADDYLAKPFAPVELLARIRALLRRAGMRPEPFYAYGPVRIQTTTRQATVDGREVLLSAREWAVLEALVARPGAVLSRTQIEERLYGWDDDVSSNAVEVFVHGLRRKLGAELIRNLRGVGYFVPASQ